MLYKKTKNRSASCTRILNYQSWFQLQAQTAGKSFTGKLKKYIIQTVQANQVNQLSQVDAAKEGHNKNNPSTLIVFKKVE